MTQRTRSRKRTAFGLFAMILGTGSLIGLSSTSYYFGLGLFGPAGYGAVMIAIGLALILRKDSIE